MNETLKRAFPYINKWATEGRRCQIVKTSEHSISWANEYFEYTLEYNDTTCDLMLTGVSCEISREMLFYIPVGQTEGFFDNIIKLVGHA